MTQGGCYHCGLPVAEPAPFSLVIDGAPRAMCCRGCLAVAQAIVDNNLQAYYRHRTAMPATGKPLVPEALGRLTLYDRPEIQHSFVRATAPHLKQATLILEGITCAACIWLNERHLLQLPGVTDVYMNYSTHRARITWDERKIALSDVLREITLLGYDAHPYSVETHEALRRARRQTDIRRIAVAGIAAAQIMMLAVGLYAGAAFGMDESTRRLLRYLSFALSVPVVAYAALPFYRSAFSALRRRALNMDVPVVIALIAGFVGSAWATFHDVGVVFYDSLAMLTFTLLVTRYLERNAHEKSTEAAENLLKMTPALVTRVELSGSHVVVAAVELREGDRIMIKPGETIAADGVIEAGAGNVDEALLSGESRPIAKLPGATVIAGSLNLDTPLTVRVTGTGENTVLAGIVRVLDRAIAEKPRFARMADAVAARFTYVILIAAAVAAFAWSWVDPSRTLPIALALLVITCPCALSLAAPAAFAAAGGRLLSDGVLLKSPTALETLAKVTYIAFDKTGTLTHGRPQLRRTHVIGPLSETRCLQLAASLEQASEHAVARGFLAAVDARTYLPVQARTNQPGVAVTGEIEGALYRLGRAPQSAPIIDCSTSATMVWLTAMHDDQALAAFEFEDSIRAEAKEVVQTLQSAGFKTSILSGDSAGAVAATAAHLKVGHFSSGLTPEQKLAEIRALQAQGEVVAMVGDGINDAPVLAGADVSLAMAGGTQLAHASSDVVLMGDDLRKVAHVIETAQATRGVMHQNFVWAIGYNMVAMPFAALGFVPPWLAAVGMSSSSLIVVLNALRLRKRKKAEAPMVLRPA